MTRLLIVFSFAAIFAACSAPFDMLSGKGSTDTRANPDLRVLHASDVEWGALNPARGDASPRAATLWGDRNGVQPTGFLAKFADGFSSPPHIHNVTYRAVVIDGYIHNDDPDAASLWMGNGSFWTQPVGETHITAASGANNLALVEIDHGPYRVHPTEQAFDSGERPLNLDASNVVWLPMSQQHEQSGGAEVAYLWGTVGGHELNGSFVKLPPGFKGVLISNGDVFHGVVIRGNVTYRHDGLMDLTPGSYFGTKGPADHRIASEADAESIIYIRTNGTFELRQRD